MKEKKELTQEQYESILNYVERNACVNSFYEFVVSFWGTIIEETMVDNWHIRYLCDELQKLSVNIVARKPKLYDLIINIPPGTTKSTITTIMFPVWLWTQDPSLRIITNSYSSDLALEHAVKSRDICYSAKFKKLFPEIQIRGDKGAKSSYENVFKGARYSTSTGGMIMGVHSHVIINDDPMNLRQSKSKLKRDEANNHTKTLSSRKISKENTPMITIMQRLHVKDVTGYLLGKKKDIKHICLPCRVSKMVMPEELKQFYENGLLDNNRLPERVLQEAMIDLGTRDFAGQYEQSPTEAGGNIFKRVWFQKISISQFNALKGIISPVFFVDTAFTDKQTNDPTGIVTTYKIGNDIYIRHSQKMYKKFPDLIRALPTYVRTLGYTQMSSIRIEPKANGISVIQQLKEATKLNITNTPSPKESKETRANSISSIVECQRVFLVEGDWNDDFLDEVCAFPRAEHDEYVDLLVYAVNYHLKRSNDWANSELTKLKGVL